MKKKFLISLMIISILELNLFSDILQKSSIEREIPKLKYLITKTEIQEYFDINKNLYFGSISDICCDDEDCLFVADSGWGCIRKFDASGKYLFSIGREGQGPGEFIGKPIPIKISFGNDRKLYISDSNNRKISIFSKEGVLLKEIKCRSSFFDKAIANSQGNIFLLERMAGWAISRYDDNLELKDKILNRAEALRFPYMKPKLKEEIFSKMDLNDNHIFKMITNDDHLVVVSNHTLQAYHFGPSNEFINQFELVNKALKEDLLKTMKLTIERGGFLFPFKGCIDDHGLLALLYSNFTKKRLELYRYDLAGKLKDIIAFPQDGTGNIVCFSQKGDIYRIIDKIKIDKYQIKEEGL